jgi:hypothetical protein
MQLLIAVAEVVAQVEVVLVALLLAKAQAVQAL